MQNHPNIFTYATSELSQDAFIAWLLSWADAKYKVLNKQLHQLGLDFLKSLLIKQNIGLTEISNLKIETQFHKIDVFVSFIMDARSYGVIIEDKVFSSNHSGQLKKYKEFIENKNFDVVAPIYFKTGFQHCYKDVESKGYKPYTIKEFIRVLQKGISEDIDNAILINYYDYVIEREKWFDRAKFKFENYREESISEWDWWSCTGFFNDNHKRLNANWGSVGNNRQPLLAMWCKGFLLHTEDVDSGIKLELHLYIDVIHSKGGLNINFRIGNLKDFPQNNNRNRNKIYNKFNVALTVNNIKHRKPHFRKSNGTICLAQVTEIDKTLMHNDLMELLQQYNKIVQEFVKNFTNA